jgi:hypothetical protein
MTGARRIEPGTAVPSTPPPCRSEPNRWFDPAHRTHALAACLQCPARRWCAQEALRTRAAWGMWAGIWIDGTHTEVAHNLEAIATDAPAVPTAPATPLQTWPPQPVRDTERRPLSRTGPTRPGRPQSVAAAVLARSSGQCEVMAAECRLTADTQVSRLVGVMAGDAASAAVVYAACARCADAVSAAFDPMAARRLGYVVDSPTQAPDIPFYWRQCRWVLLGRAGQLLDARAAAEAARAS